ncbi:hypothetical protein SIN07_05710 [Pediococcus inopinatus]|uniref:hypothetical protein n=1 Tax=Pediococcus inopinatus TaxID=114090 RepID=UPI002A6A52FA|nr:hypothetical protein [Pediococcus inopinatus]WPP08541.1 hypothetical protein SIN07_05710 [Pediococcus inopinatus]
MKIIGNYDEVQSLVDTAKELGSWQLDKKMVEKEFKEPEDGILIKEADMHIDYLQQYLNQIIDEAFINDTTTD